MHDLELIKNCIPKSQAMFTVFTQIPLSSTNYVTIFKHESGCVFFFFLKGVKTFYRVAAVFKNIHFSFQCLVH